MGFWGAIGGAVAGNLVGGLLGNKGASDAAQTAREGNYEVARDFNPHKLLNDYSGGKYSDYLSKYAFASPQEQGEFARAMMSAQFPELTPWELAGTPSAGVAGAMGQNANESAQQTAAAESQMQTQLQTESIRANTQLQVAKMQTQAQMANSAIGAYASMNNAETSAEASNYATDVGSINVDKQMAPAMAKLNSEVENIQASTVNLKSNSDLANANTQNAVNEALLFELKKTGIELDNETKQQVMEKMKIEMSNMSNSQSQVGKTFSDIKARFVEAVKTSVENKPSLLRRMHDGAEGIQQFIHDQIGKFKHGENYMGLGGATSGQGPNNYRHPTKRPN